MDSAETKKSRFFMLYNQIQVRLYCYLVSIVHNRSDAEDILQETSVIMWEKFEQFEEGTNFDGWAMRIAQIKALEFMRKNKRTRMVFDDCFYEAVSDYSIGSSVDVTDRSEALQNCLKKASANNLKLLSMRFDKQLPVKNIASSTGRSPNSLYQTYTRILTSLRHCMDKYIAQKAL